MKKRIYSIISFALLLVLCAGPVYRTKAEEIQVQQIPVTEDVIVTDNLNAADTTDVNAEADAQAVLAQQVAAVTAEQQSRQIVFIGDSRTVGMKGAVGKDNNVWSAKVGMGLTWMKSTGVPAVESDINANTDVVILMGVNDVRSLSYTKKYISYLNEKAAVWTALGANVYYVSVNPMVFETSSYPGITNELIENWNARMQQGLSSDISYIDTYSQVLGQLSSKDGIHYNNKSYKLIYSLINQGIINDKVLKEYYSI
ncbi:SGNH/GDSL hydrolase family protein [Pseudobutyrivibrio xylanivorans]|uniref:SGNH/GDSL hydrolase family protein n=1 Tax=Pseudobutyrivibrio xylanivorans TaxID=185007 RepID=A0A5P6VQM0_PSEXY|nr:SGNH/GDSL hydrolase family protein [Pseudobutyrivibrio xylanivorans]QFJ54897.1 SGNH/GDSL hydrolase family protein [Pseudobutyrivibrio xylanivorans]